MRIGISCFGHRLGEAGGAQVYLRELVNALAAFDRANDYFLLKWSSDPVATANGNRHFQTVSWPGLPLPLFAKIRRFVTIYGFRRWKDDRAKAIDRLALDVIHFPASLIFPTNLSAPSVLTLFDLQHEFYPEYFTLPTLLKRRIVYRASVREATRIISPSEYTAKTMLERYLVPPAKIRKIPAGIAEKFYRPSDDRACAAVRREYGLPREYLLYPANTWPHKNHERLLQALALLRSKHKQVINLVCIGAQMPGQATLEQLAKKHGLADGQVLSLGFVSPDIMPTLYGAARLLVFPSLFEGFGMPVAEAMACGCPVVCSNTTSLPEVAGEAALTVDPLDIEQIAEAIHLGWADLELRARLRDAGLQRAERFRWSHIIEDVYKVYAEGSD